MGGLPAGLVARAQALAAGWLTDTVTIARPSGLGTGVTETVLATAASCRYEPTRGGDLAGLPGGIELVAPRTVYLRPTQDVAPQDVLTFADGSRYLVRAVGARTDAAVRTVYAERRA